MLERTDAITNEVLEPIAFVLAYPTILSCLGRYFTEKPRVILATVGMGVHMLLNADCLLALPLGKEQKLTITKQYIYV